jgi:hypothetical protein
VHLFLTHDIWGARPILMLAVKRGVIWQVGRGRHLRRLANWSVLAEPQPSDVSGEGCGEGEECVAKMRGDVRSGSSCTRIGLSLRAIPRFS